MKRPSTFAILILFASVVCMAPVSAQRANGSVTGQVKDASGSGIPGITVLATGPTTRSTATSSDGTYTLGDLAPGVYRLEVRAPGFASVVLSDAEIRAGASFEWNPRINVKMSGTTPVSDYLEMFTGKGARPCGSLGAQTSEPEMLRAVECAKAAAAAKVPFVVVRLTAGLDSELASGLVGTPAGTVFQFDYDSRPCGGAGCESRFSVSKCPDPWVGRRMAIGEPSFFCRTPE